MLQIAIDSEIDRKLEALGALDDSSKTALIRRALTEALDDELECQSLAKLADQRRDSESSGKVWSLEELERADDLDD